ncbi:peptidoglycan hydrolase-like protein with peptidoglycan-binding domain [Virgibacillus halotolerans]|uniref:glycoside hydrolase domain-containing protein n=1 Tax=Virgibacillus halotolerans TaxID=1071053 RepID=UPI00196086C6|nr:glycoside hydrolase domain-containing protein [Virgibacillus halotolerans]MBM7597690.1 peptidoglycan hydrolase-like protein with peptidoglycan-binding domain [Virgibacillus halotolerans]
MDEMVLTVQEWVNKTYKGYSGYDEIEENGKTGWSTVYALTKGLQAELGITSLANNFGPGTEAAYKEWGEMEVGKVPNNDKGRNIVLILQGAMYCTGYNPGGFDGEFGEPTKGAVQKLQNDAGLPIQDGKVYDYVFKATLTMNAYVLTSNGDYKVQEIQRDLNNKYYKTSGVQPCDGHYQRNTNKSLLYGVQTEEDIPASEQTGAIGPKTIERLPILDIGSSGNFVKLFQYALYFNGYDSGEFDGVYGTGIKNTTAEFQKFVGLDEDGSAGKQTWLSALVSTGDPDRKGTACDCITEITPERAQALKDEGYETVGRYLTNAERTSQTPNPLDKRIKPGEIDTIFDAGLTMFPIYQTEGGDNDYFTEKKGKLDGGEAFVAAKEEYGFKSGTTIYFAVDFDVLDHQITSNILPYFSAINKVFKDLGSLYKVGVYGPRNACIRVSKAGLASTSFISGMSTGFSGNLGFPLPDNWAFDQISTIKVGSGDGLIQIDNNIKSGRDNGADSAEPGDIEESINKLFFEQIDDIYEIALKYSDNSQAKANELLCQYLRHRVFNGVLWVASAGKIDTDFIEQVDKQLHAPTIVDPFDINHKVSLETPHLAASLNSILFIWNSNSFISDFAGWAGDLLTVAGESVDAVDDSRYSTVYDAAYNLIGNRDASKSTFTLKDLIVDVDALNMGATLRRNLQPLNKVIKEYYGKLGEYNRRYNSFLINRFFDQNEEQSYDHLLDEATDILNSKTSLIDAARVLFKNHFEVTSYTEEEGVEVARAFRDVIKREGDKESPE